MKIEATLRLHGTMAAIDAEAWNHLLAAQGAEATPFLRHEYLTALEASGSATAERGWEPCHAVLERGGELLAACPLYRKAHSYGEYVFDFAWANAYRQHGLAYYPKALCAVPFTPVPGARLLARDADARVLLLRGLVQWCGQEGLSSLHLLFTSDADAAACEKAGLLLRDGYQFHWTQPPAAPYASFDTFLAALSQDKRKKIRQERRKVADAGVVFRHARGSAISAADWDFFYRCYARTYREHGNPPYLTRDFFARMAATLPQAWLLFVAEHAGRPVACSLIALDTDCDAAPVRAAYGRYWGALERVDSLHFEACYYQPIAWCIANRVPRFEGGAQGEHKMARALMPVATRSAHWLAHPAFADAVERFLGQEREGLAGYGAALAARSPFRHD